MRSRLVGGERRVRRKESGRLASECRVELEEGAVARVGIREEYGVGVALAQPVGVRYRNHLIENAVEHERRMADGAEIGSRLLPLTKGCQLGGSDGRPRCRVEVVASFPESRNKLRSSRLAGGT